MSLLSNSKRSHDSDDNDRESSAKKVRTETAFAFSAFKDISYCQHLVSLVLDKSSNLADTMMSVYGTPEPLTPQQEHALKQILPFTKQHILHDDAYLIYVDDVAWDRSISCDCTCDVMKYVYYDRYVEPFTCVFDFNHIAEPKHQSNDIYIFLIIQKYSIEETLLQQPNITTTIPVPHGQDLTHLLNIQHLPHMWKEALQNPDRYEIYYNRDKHLNGSHDDSIIRFVNGEINGHASIVAQFLDQLCDPKHPTICVLVDRSVAVVYASAWKRAWNAIKTIAKLYQIQGGLTLPQHIQQQAPVSTSSSTTLISHHDETTSTITELHQTASGYIRIGRIPYVGTAVTLSIPPSISTTTKTTTTGSNAFHLPTQQSTPIYTYAYKQVNIEQEHQATPWKLSVGPLQVQSGNGTITSSNTHTERESTHTLGGITIATTSSSSNK